jgi:hypothetical protein
LGGTLNAKGHINIRGGLDERYQSISKR